jgi:hypothetical protein
MNAKPEQYVLVPLLQLQKIWFLLGLPFEAVSATTQLGRSSCDPLQRALHFLKVVRALATPHGIEVCLSAGYRPKASGPHMAYGTVALEHGPWKSVTSSSGRNIDDCEPKMLFRVSSRSFEGASVSEYMYNICELMYPSCAVGN